MIITCLNILWNLFIMSMDVCTFGRWMDMGRRKQELCPSTMERIKALMIEKYPVRRICDVLGIDKSSWYRWVKEGEQGMKEREEFYRLVSEYSNGCSSRRFREK